MSQLELLEKKLNQSRKVKIRVHEDLHVYLSKLAGGQRIPLAALIRSAVLEYIERNPLPRLAQPPPDEDLLYIEKIRPEALVYTVPINGAKIIASKHPDGGWRGLLWKTDQAGSISTWRSENLAPPPWAQTPRVVKTLMFVASRVEEGSESVFHVPGSSYLISATWSGKRFDGGRVVDVKRKIDQEWTRGKDWYATMLPGKLTCNSNIRRLVNMLCRVLAAGDGGLTTKVPLQ